MGLFNGQAAGGLFVLTRPLSYERIFLSVIHQRMKAGKKAKYIESSKFFMALRENRHRQF